MYEWPTQISSQGNFQALFISTLSFFTLRERAGITTENFLDLAVGQISTTAADNSTGTTMGSTTGSTTGPTTGSTTGSTAEKLAG